MEGKIDSFANRLKQAMRLRNIKATDLSAKTGISKSSLSEYINGKYEAKQDGVYLLSKALDVNEAWLMGFNVTITRTPDEARINNLKAYTASALIDADGLDAKDIEEINRYIEFIKNKKKEKK